MWSECTATERRREPEMEGTLQVTDDEIAAAQQRSRLVQKLVMAGDYHGRKVEPMYGLVIVNTKHGRRVVLPLALWAIVF
ncbi:hypothetical protein PC128_g16521 [Phytophthora cactorum]|nr:hypothetical protein PC120_g22776 [Phytophthora cactorum]KAG3057335.1 hypothetical protein PC121_g14875 [Phytophthora cactorum]KAG3178162.1 hypothetical protein PC128_g16521 [Phytophthora cactorum]KAG4041237.1 hypothetical protein PC123_g23244 [Phytophthora cactorum]